ncbi:MAG: hypothetical protein HQL96_07325 [Magnetococcales bacterium]|nr:hypothetical protein [Magnetococcales bacterium]
MMLATTFDTHRYVKEMIATGFTEEQAETHARLLVEILGDQLSTREEMAKLDAKVLEIIRWFVSLSLVQLGVMCGILFAILRLLPAH